MVLEIAGAVIVGGVVLAAIYDFVARRRGTNVSVRASGPLKEKNSRVDVTHEEYYRR